MSSNLIVLNPRLEEKRLLEEELKSVWGISKSLLYRKERRRKEQGTERCFVK